MNDEKPWAAAEFAVNWHGLPLAFDHNTILQDALTQLAGSYLDPRIAVSHRSFSG
jgi:hypothetical protein